MKIVNKTHWRTDHLRAFLRRAADTEFSGLPDKWKRGVATFVYTRRNGSSYSSGCATLNGFHMTIRLSKHTPDKIDLAEVIAHEMAHLRGMTHDKMRGSPLYRRVGRHREIYAWGDTLPLEIKPPRTKKRPGPDVKLEHARKMLARNETKLKRITTIVKKWRLKVRYYERRELAVAAQKGTDTNERQL
jgi:hypothetical protein